MKLYEFIKTFATQGGLEESNTELVKLLENKDNLSVDIPDTVLNSITNHFTNNLGKESSELKKYFRAIVLNEADSKIKGVVESLDGLDESDKEVFIKEKDTYKKIGLLAEKVAALEAKKLAAKTSGDKSVVQKQIEEATAKITDLQKALESKEADKANEIKALMASFDNERMNGQLQSILNNIEYSEALGHLPKEVITGSALALVQAELGKSKAKMKYTDGKINLVSAEDESIPFRDKSLQVIATEDFIKGVIANNKMNKVTATATTVAKPATPVQQGNTNNHTSNLQMQSVAAKNLAALEAFNANAGS